jgi:hypothetical protein
MAAPQQVRASSSIAACDLCSALGSIVEGELFTRHKAGNIRISPHCRDCSPFEIGAAVEGTSSLLLKALFESQAETGKPVPSTAQASSEKITEGVKRRLGPALERARRSR